MSNAGRDTSRGHPNWNQNPPQFDASITKRSSPDLCGVPDGERDDYDFKLHIGAVFVILFVSASACAFPLIATKFPRLRVPPKFLFFIRHFGTGVLLATAFVHLLPTAFENLLDDCLGEFWTEKYPAMAGAIALMAVFVVATIEQIFSPGKHCMTITAVERNASVPLEELREPAPAPARAESGDESPQPASQAPGVGPLYGRTKLGRTDSTGRSLARMTSDAAQMDRIERENPDAILRSRSSGNEQAKKLSDAELGEAEPEVSPDQKRQKLLLQCVLLEVGILFHSIFIGMALAVATGSDFIVLLLAIIFHQTFEGLALGSRIAAVGWSPQQATTSFQRSQPWLMALAYGCTTPLGQVLGIATHTLYTPDSRTGLLMVGIMNAISAGLLTYTSLIDLLAEDFISDESWRYLKGTKRVVAGCVVFAGAAGMSLIGAWA